MRARVGTRSRDGTMVTKSPPVAAASWPEQVLRVVAAPNARVVNGLPRVAEPRSRRRDHRRRASLRAWATAAVDGRSLWSGRRRAAVGASRRAGLACRGGVPRGIGTRLAVLTHGSSTSGNCASSTNASGRRSSSWSSTNASVLRQRVPRASMCVGAAVGSGPPSGRVRRKPGSPRLACRVRATVASPPARLPVFLLRFALATGAGLESRRCGSGRTVGPRVGRAMRLAAAPLARRGS